MSHPKPKSRASAFYGVEIIQLRRFFGDYPRFRRAIGSSAPVSIAESNANAVEKA